MAPQAVVSFLALWYDHNTFCNLSDGDGTTWTLTIHSRDNFINRVMNYKTNTDPLLGHLWCFVD